MSLLSAGQILPAQEMNKDSISIVELHSDSSVILIQPRGCVSIFENQTVTSSLSVLGCNTLTVQNVAVTNVGNLTLSAPQYITINGTFEVQLGGILSINDKLVRFVFQYDYDAAGNRITRRFSTTSPANAVSE